MGDNGLTKWERFEQLEREYSLFNIEINNTHIWERLRYTVFQQITGSPESTNADDSIINKELIRGLRLWVQNILYKNPYLSSSKEFIFVGTPRRKRLEDGFWWDIYCDPVQDRCPFDSVQFEAPFQFQHFTPAKTQQLRYLDLIIYSGSILRRIWSDLSIPEPQKRRLKELEKELLDKFDAHVDLNDMARQALCNRKYRTRLYKQLLAKVDPKIAVVIASYGKEDFIEACKNKSIPVAELQHGVIHPGHFGYSFPKTKSKATFPDYLLLWGEFWNENINFPIPNDRVFVSGYPYMELTKQKYDSVKQKNQILFVSQQDIGFELSKLAIEAKQHPEMNRDIVYKLHPKEYTDWEKKYPRLKESEIKVVDDSGPQLYELFVESSAQVGVYSTGLYEGLAFCLDTYIYDCPNSEVMRPLIEDGAADSISSVENLIRSVNSRNKRFVKERYFAPNAIEKTSTTLKNLAENGSTYQR